MVWTKEYQDKVFENIDDFVDGGVKMDDKLVTGKIKKKSKSITVMDDIPEKFFNKRQRKNTTTLKDIKTIYLYELNKIISGISSIFSIKFTDSMGTEIDKIVRNLPDGEMKTSNDGVWLTDINAKKKNIGDIIFISYDSVVGIGTKGQIFIVRRNNKIKLRSF